MTRAQERECLLVGLSLLQMAVRSTRPEDAILWGGDPPSVGQIDRLRRRIEKAGALKAGELPPREFGDATDQELLEELAARGFRCFQPGNHWTEPQEPPALSDELEHHPEPPFGQPTGPNPMVGQMCQHGTWRGICTQGCASG